MTDTPPAKTNPADPAAPVRYLLSKETWALILEEYQQGASASELVLKWRVSEHTLRRQVTRHGATKRKWGDARVIEEAAARDAELQAMQSDGAPSGSAQPDPGNGQTFEVNAELRATGLQSRQAVAAQLFNGIKELDDDEAGDPAALAKLATRASGRAMIWRLWTEARALAGLAESYSRLAERARAAEGETGEPEMDPTHPGRLAALEYLRRRAAEREAERAAREAAEAEPKRQAWLDYLRREVARDLDEEDGAG